MREDLVSCVIAPGLPNRAQGDANSNAMRRRRGGAGGLFASAVDLAAPSAEPSFGSEKRDEQIPSSCSRATGPQALLQRSCSGRCSL